MIKFLESIQKQNPSTAFVTKLIIIKYSVYQEFNTIVSNTNSEILV